MARYKALVGIQVIKNGRAEPFSNVSEADRSALELQMATEIERWTEKSNHILGAILLIGTWSPEKRDLMFDRIYAALQEITETMNEAPNTQVEVFSPEQMESPDDSEVN